MLLSQCLDFFILHCQIKGLSDKTIEDYNFFVNRFIRSVGDMESGLLDYKVVEQYALGLYQSPRKLSRATIATYMRHLKVFVKYLEGEGYIDCFSTKIKIPKASKRLLKIYTDDEIKQIFSSIKIMPDWIRYRNCVIVALMLDSGLRQAEVCQIGMLDIDRKNSYLKVHGKGDKERLVPIGKLTKYYIDRYLQSRPYKSDEKFLLTRSGKQITKNTVKLFVNKLSHQLPFEFSSHKLRHNFATNYCIDEYERIGTVDIYKLMMLLGHEDTMTTRIYMHLANQVILSKTNVSHLDKIFK